MNIVGVHVVQGEVPDLGNVFKISVQLGGDLIDGDKEEEQRRHDGGRRKTTT